MNPIVDLSGLSVEHQEVAYRASRLRAIQNPGKGVPVNFKINPKAKLAVELFIGWGDRPGFYLAV